MKRGERRDILEGLLMHYFILMSTDPQAWDAETAFEIRRSIVDISNAQQDQFTDIENRLSLLEPIFAEYLAAKLKAQEMPLEAPPSVFTGKEPYESDHDR